VYLHDTPSKNLFDADDRAFSSGCIRVEDPMALAERLLAGDPEWTREAIDLAVEGGKTRTVNLKQPVPVLLTYWTSWVARTGELQFRRDIYSRDVKVLEGLASAFRFGSVGQGRPRQ
jgi:murein L,D-transpeptidase YcbB/YkuD